MQRRTVLARVACLTACWALCACKPRENMPAQPPAESSPEAPRVVVLSPAIAITMRDLGMAHLIVARHAWDNVTDPSVPICGDQSGIDYETLMRVNPTHVLTQWGERQLPRRLRQYAQQNAWQTHDFRLLELHEIGACADDLVSMFGSDIDTARCRFDLSRTISEQINDRFARITSIRTNAQAGATTLMLASIEPIAALGPGSWHVQLLESLGGTSAITAGGAYITLELEDVVRLAPNHIVLFAPRAIDLTMTPKTSNHVLDMLGSIAHHESIPAIAHRRIALIDNPNGLSPSTAIVDVADELRALLVKWAAETQAPPVNPNG